MASRQLRSKRVHRVSKHLGPPEPLEDRRLLAAVSWGCENATDSEWDNPANWIGGAVPASSDDVTILCSGDAVVELPGQQATVASLSVSEELHIKATSEGDARLTVTGVLHNRGSVILDSDAFGKSASIYGAIVNDASGLLRIGSGAVGGRTLVGSMVNLGSIQVDQDLSVVGQFEQRSGTVRGSGETTIWAGELNWLGGAIEASVGANGGKIEIGDGVTTAGTLFADGVQSTLAANRGDNVAIHVRTDVAGGVLTGLPGAVNEGTILIDGGSRLASSDDSILVNRETGTIKEVPNGRGARLSGQLANYGTIDVQDDLRISGALELAAGEIRGKGSLGIGGEFVWSGGEISADVWIEETRLTITDDVTSAATIRSVFVNQLVENRGDQVTIAVNGALRADAESINEGTIHLDGDEYLEASLNVYYLRNSGTIIASGQREANRYISGTIINSGHIQADNTLEIVSYLRNEQGTLDGDLFFRGWFDPGSGTETTSICGNVRFGILATLDIDVDGPEKYDTLVVDGDVVFDGRVHVSLGQGYDGPPVGTATELEVIRSQTASGTPNNSYVEKPGVFAWANPKNDTVTVTLLTALPGDANGDGAVDGRDFLLWNTHKFTSNATWDRGDFNRDNRIDNADFLLWNANKFKIYYQRAGDHAGVSAVAEIPQASPAIGSALIPQQAGVRHRDRQWGYGTLDRIGIADIFAGADTRVAEHESPSPIIQWVRALHSQSLARS